MGYRRLVLECREGNAAAIGFYRRLGYAVCENIPRTAMKRMPFAWKSRSSATRNEGRKPSLTIAERLLIAPVDSHNMNILTDMIFEKVR